MKASGTCYSTKKDDEVGDIDHLSDLDGGHNLAAKRAGDDARTPFKTSLRTGAAAKFRLNRRGCSLSGSRNEGSISRRFKAVKRCLSSFPSIVPVPSMARLNFMKRIYHPHNLWEEWKFGMWKSISGEERDFLLKKAIKFTGDAELYGSYMLRVIEEWPYSCEHNLSCQDMNRQAWIGHAACCLAIGCPEDITRTAWHYLSQKQQDDANKRADEAIKKWEEKYRCQRNTSQLTFFHLLEIE